MRLLIWLENTPVAAWIASSSWAYPIMLTLHALGMALVVGIIVTFSVRILGYSATLPLPILSRLVPLAWLGFALNLTTGLLLFLPTASEFVLDWAFQVKIALIVLGGLAAWRLSRPMQAEERPRLKSEPFVPGFKILAAASLVLWVGAIVAGRLIAYTE